MRVGLTLELASAGALVLVVATHVAERFGWVPWMGWGRPDSAGHYLDLASAIAGLVLLPTGYALRKHAKRRISG